MSPGKRRPFDEMDLPDAEDHPLDVFSRNRMSVALNDKVKSATQTLVDTLGSDISPWLELEALLNESRQAREEILYNLGFDHGMVAGRSRALAAIQGGAGDEQYRQFADEVRKQALLSELPATIRVAALLEVAWALVLELK